MRRRGQAGQLLYCDDGNQQVLHNLWWRGQAGQLLYCDDGNQQVLHNLWWREQARQPLCCGNGEWPVLCHMRRHCQGGQPLCCSGWARYFLHSRWQLWQTFQPHGCSGGEGMPQGHVALNGIWHHPGWQRRDELWCHRPLVAADSQGLFEHQRRQSMGIHQSGTVENVLTGSPWFV